MSTIMKTPAWILMARNGGAVVRSHVVRTLHPETVAQHSFGVATILVYLYEGQAPAHMLQAALFHDLSEQHHGDVPATAKWDSPALRKGLQEVQKQFDEAWDIAPNLTPAEHRILKWADALDLLFFCRDERHMGNNHRTMKVMEFNIFNFLEDHAQQHPHPVGQRVLDWYVRREGRPQA